MEYQKIINKIAVALARLYDGSITKASKNSQQNNWER